MGKKYHSFWSPKRSEHQEDKTKGWEDRFRDSSKDPTKYVNHTYSGYYGGYGGSRTFYSSTPTYSYSSSKTEIVEKFRKVYKHIDDFKSIVNIPERVKLLFKEGFTIREGQSIHIKTEMFDTIKDYNEALDVCLGGALIEFAKYHSGNEYLDIEKELLSFSDYEDFILSSYPGYAYLIEQYKTYKEGKSELFKNREDVTFVQAKFSEIFTTSDSKDEWDIRSPSDPEETDGAYRRRFKENQDLRKLVGTVSKDLKDTLMTDMAEGAVTRDKDSFSHHELNDEEEYKYALQRISPYISMVSNSLGQFFVNTKVRHYGSRNGTLDSNKLVEAIQGAPNVYYHEFERRTTQLDVCIVIDESGSMSFDSRIELAQQAAILLNEACKQLTCCNLYIYGHSADIIEKGKTNIYCYKDNTHTNPYALGGVRARLENRDGDALRQIAKKVREQTSNTVLMFVLSDGAPAAYEYYGEYGIRDTKEAVKEIEKQKFIVTQCTFRGTHVPSDKMFSNYIEIDNTDESEFATKFTKYVSGTLLKNYQVTES